MRSMAATATTCSAAAPGPTISTAAAGIDTASYYTGSTGVVVSLVTGIGSGGEAQDDTLVRDREPVRQPGQ